MREKDPDKYPARWVVEVLRMIAHVLSKIFWFLRYRGLENIPDRSIGGFMIAANHQTYFDPVWICPPIKHRRFRFMAWDGAFEWGCIGPLITYLGAFPVSMEVGEALDAMREALRTLRDGAALVVFPEGEREFADGKTLPFKTGAVRIALHAGVPILPVTIKGGNRIWPQERKYPRLFRRVEIIYHPLLEAKEYQDLAPHEILEKCTSILKNIISNDDEMAAGKLDHKVP